MLHHFMFLRTGAGGLAWYGIGFLLVVGLVLLIVFLTDRKNKGKSAAETTPEDSATASVDPHSRIMEILRVQCEADQTTAADYEERRMILEGGKTDNYRSKEIVDLKERYARLEITTQAYIEERSKLLKLQ
jgi:uncharacterized membrane protein